ncbi:MAG: lytic murein transglycosylase [Aeromicrobium sp.]|uniref:lytic murein transglycosylase n=1 Tax=Aeromicrobium sp. TaxID=1871063 RepID=UPI0039E331ED
MVNGSGRPRRGVVAVAAGCGAVILLATAGWLWSQSGRVQSATPWQSALPGQVSTLGSGDVQGVDSLADPAWVAQTASATGIPSRALASYAGATLAVAKTHPDCGLSWTTLAAIGYVESEHGTIYGGKIDSDGVARPQVVGVALNGAGVAGIADTDGGEVDGDPQWDRAVGPMQFIPSTWESYAQDGDLDQMADIHDLDDAALAAAVYLCQVGGDLTVASNWIAAVSAYNVSVEYNNRVVAAADHYASLAD